MLFHLRWKSIGLQFAGAFILYIASGLFYERNDTQRGATFVCTALVAFQVSKEGFKIIHYECIRFFHLDRDPQSSGSGNGIIQCFDT